MASETQIKAVAEAIRIAQLHDVGINAVAKIAIEAYEASLWRPIEEAPPNKPVLVYYKNAHEKSRVVIAVFIPRYTNEDDGENAEYCQEKDRYYTLEGWYELIDNWDDFTYVTIYEGKPTHFMHLPNPPKAADKFLKGE